MLPHLSYFVISVLPMPTGELHNYSLLFLCYYYRYCFMDKSHHIYYVLAFFMNVAPAKKSTGLPGRHRLDATRQSPHAFGCSS